MRKPKFYEFFAGAGMARAGLEPNWKCLFANDFDPLKVETYSRNWGRKELRECDVGLLRPCDLPEGADLAWASFPCQDLSIAGAGNGLDGKRSAAFWSYCDLLQQLHNRRRLPYLLVLENVTGALTSRSGRDFLAITRALADLNYYFGALVLDAAHFVPQSRPRLFIIAVRGPKRRISDYFSDRPASWATSDVLLRTYEKLPSQIKKRWIWWKLPKPTKRRSTLSSIVAQNQYDESWHPEDETARLLRLMASDHKQKISHSQKRRETTVGTVYRRMRREKSGAMKQRAEVRFDNIAGCLRTPSGGSSRQIVISVGRTKVRTRHLAIKEGAKLMGLPAGYKLPQNYYDAFKVLGDGLAVPLVRHISSSLLLPLARLQDRPVSL